MIVPIDDPWVEQEIREEARRTGASESDVVRRAVIGGLAQWRAQRRATAEWRLAEEHRAWLASQGLTRSPRPTPEELEARLARLRELQDEIGKLPILDLRSDEDIIGYDEHGLPS